MQEIKNTKYIKFTYVLDPVTKGPRYPDISSLEFVFARESQYPTAIPEFFGTCLDTEDTNKEGVLQVLNEHDFNLAYQDELLARENLQKAKAKITKLAFRNRFTQPEKVLIELAALDDPSADQNTRAQSAALRAYLKDMEVATFIDLTREDTRLGVEQLEVLGLIAQGRAEEIMSLDIQDNEIYKG